MAPAKKAAKKAPVKKATKKATKSAPAKKATKKAAKKATKRTAKKTSAASANGGQNVIVASKLRDVVRSHDIRMSSDLIEALNGEVHQLVSKAVTRAKGNNRGTVRGSDL